MTHMQNDADALAGAAGADMGIHAGCISADDTDRPTISQHCAIRRLTTRFGLTVPTARTCGRRRQRAGGE
jgi:hypothetical protein